MNARHAQEIKNLETQYKEQIEALKNQHLQNLLAFKAQSEPGKNQKPESEKKTNPPVEEKKEEGNGGGDKLNGRVAKTNISNQEKEENKKPKQSSAEKLQWKNLSTAYKEIDAVFETVKDQWQDLQNRQKVWQIFEALSEVDLIKFFITPLPQEYLFSNSSNTLSVMEGYTPGNLSSKGAWVILKFFAGFGDSNGKTLKNRVAIDSDQFSNELKTSLKDGELSKAIESAPSNIDSFFLLPKRRFENYSLLGLETFFDCLNQEDAKSLSEVSIEQNKNEFGRILRKAIREKAQDLLTELQRGEEDNILGL